MNSMHYIVMTTTENEADALRIARAAVQRKLAACVQIVGPIRSVYRWQEQVEEAEEFRCELKTRGDQCEALEAMIQEMHPYELPEVIAVPIVYASKAYQAWLDEQ